MSRRNKIIFHLTFWLLSISLSVYAWGLKYFKPEIWDRWLFDTGFTHFSAAFYFYINYSILIPYFFNKKKYYIFAILTLISILFHIITCTFLWYDHHLNNLFSLTVDQLAPMAYECVFYGMISTGLSVTEGWVNSEQRKQLLEKELKEIELLFLQSQMSPHFLFNTLNNIYGLSLKNSAKTSIAISQLKDLMLYFQYFEKGEKILIEDEIEYLEGYIALQSLRNAVKVNFQKRITNQSNSILIEPMLLLPFIENAFKHGDLNKDITIILNAEPERIFFNVKNSTNSTKRKDSVGGIGIKNIGRRLELLYPSHHQIEQKVLDNTFSFTIILDLT